MTSKQMGFDGVIWFVGIVEDINDPLQLGRVRMRPIGHSDGLETADLHWATPVVPITSASLQGDGISPTGIAVNSYVVGWYLDGAERQKPLIIGTIPKIPGMNTNKHDVHKLARGEQSLKKTSVGPEPKSAYAAQYPYNKVTGTLSGHAIEIDDTPGHERIHIYHKSGTYNEINQAGRQVDKTVEDKYEIIVKDDTVYIGGNWKVQVMGNATITVAKNCTITAADTVSINGTKLVKVTGGKITLN